MEESKAVAVELQQSNAILDLSERMQLINNNNIVEDIADLEYAIEKLKRQQMRFFRVEQLSYDKDYPRREALENVLTALDNNAFNFVYVLTGNSNGIDLCIGVVENENENKPILGKQLKAGDYGKIIQSTFEGNFSGSKLKQLKDNELEDVIINSTYVYKNAGAIIGVPSINEKEVNQEDDFQGVDRLINSMQGLNWRLVVICEPVLKNDIIGIRNDIYEIYNKLVVCSKKSVQLSVNDGTSINFGKSVSKTKGKNRGYNKSESKSKGTQSQHSNSSTSTSKGTSGGTSISITKGNNSGVSLNRGTSKSVTIEIANKYAQDLMKYIDEELLERLKIGFSKGLYKTSVYYMAETPAQANRLKSGIISLFQGNNSTYSPLYDWKIDLDNKNNSKALNCYQNQYIENGECSTDALLLLGRPFEKAVYGNVEHNLVGINTYLTSKEISLLAGLPQKEVPGMRLEESVDFGLNYNDTKLDESISLGKILQRGREIENFDFKLKRDSLTKHTFIAGVTGSGKTTTCHKLLAEAKIPFLVIEPAKTEYRTLINSEYHKDVVVFTLGNETIAPFRINPFELIKGEIISAHIDMLKATFTTAFPMEASMPQILEEAIYSCYQKKGWDINTNTHKIFGDKAFENGNCFPIMSELLESLKDVVRSKHFGERLESEYLGSLVSRLSNLTIGSKGQMLNCKKSTDFRYIAHNNVILEMEDLKSAEDKALFMGFILTRLTAIIKDEHKKNKDFKHLTLIEEAHRLLSKVEYGDSGSKKSSVETFTDLLAEVRKYGEGLIVVDQIPNKLAPEVLKNTNTKIIHKILARDDKEAVGDTMLMDDKQKEYLSALQTGHAIVFSSNTMKPIHVKIKCVTDTNEEEVADDVVRNRFEQLREVLGVDYEFTDILSNYSDFKNVCLMLKWRDVDTEKVKSLNKIVMTLGNKYSRNTIEIWKVLIEWWDVESGKYICSPVCRDERIENLVNFFKNEFEREGFSKEKITRKIRSYLV